MLCKTPLQFKKRLLLLVVLFGLCFPVAGVAADKFDLQTVKDLTLKNSRALEALQIAVDTARYSKNIAEDNYTNNSAANRWRNQLAQLDYLNQLIAADPGNTNLLANKIALEAQISMTKAMMGTSTNEEIKNRYQEAQDAYSDARAAFNENEKTLGYHVETLYTSVLTLTTQLESLEKAAALKATALRIERLKKELGMSSETDVNTAVTEVLNFNRNLKTVSDSLQLLIRNLNDMMGRDLDLHLELADFEVETKPVPAYNDIVNTALSNSSSLARQERDLKQRETDLNKDNVKKDSNITGLTEKDIELKKIGLENTRAGIKNYVKALLSDLESKLTAFNTEEAHYKNVSAIHEMNVQKFNLGLISKIQLDTSETSMLESYGKYVKAKYEYFLANSKLELIKEGIMIEEATEA